MRKRTSYLTLAILGLSLAACGCQSQPASGTATNGTQEQVEAEPATNGEVADNGPPTSATPPDLGPEGDPNSPLQFKLTEEELARQAAGGSGGGFDPGALVDAVPESITSGPVGSLGNALFKGFVGAGSDSAGENSSDGETP